MDTEAVGIVLQSALATGANGVPQNGFVEVSGSQFSRTQLVTARNRGSHVKALDVPAA